MKREKEKELMFKKMGFADTKSESGEAVSVDINELNKGMDKILKQIDEKVDEVLSKETPESLQAWLLNTRAKRMGSILKEFRRNKRLTIKQVSEVSGLSLTYIHYIENGKRHPSIFQLQKVCFAVGLPVELLLFRSEFLVNIDDKNVASFYAYVMPMIEEISKLYFKF